jgi:putative aldouronate transport system permease protein
MFTKHDVLLDKILVGLIHVAMVSLLIVMIYPFWDQFIMSISMRTAALRGGFRLWTWPINLEGYRVVFKSKEILTGAMNTLYRVILGTIWTVFFTALTSYPLSRDDFPLKGLFTGVVLFTMLFSGGLIPSYLLRRDLGLIDKRLVFILPGVGAYNIIIMRNFFRSIPAEIQESAKLDGASDLQVWARIIMPLSKPVLATIALWTAVGHWNAYFDSLIYITDRSKYVLQVILRRVLLEDELISMGMQPGPEYGVLMTKPTQETVKAALLMATTLPIVFVYPFLQRYFIKGIMLGAVKG